MPFAPRPDRRPERSTERVPAASAWGAPLAAQQAWVDASPRMAAQRQSLAAVMPVQRKANTWNTQTSLKAPPLREELQVALQLPASALDAPWSEPKLAGIASHQASHAVLPTGAGAKLSQIFSDRGSNPSAVSVHADIGNLEANLRAAGGGTSSEPPTAKPIPQEPPKEGPKAQTTALDPSSLDARWNKEMATKAAKRTGRRTEEAPYQAGHLVAYQMMGDAANVFENVAPQGAQLNNVAFQNWEAGVVAGSVKELRGRLGEATPEEQVPHFFDYEVRVTYPGDKYRVPVAVLEQQGLLPKDWHTLSTAPEPPAEVALTKRIPLGWEAWALPTHESAEKYSADPVSYGIVGANGKPSLNTHFTATGPRTHAGGEVAGRAVRTLARQTRPSGLAVVAKALQVVDSQPEEAEHFLQRTPHAPSDDLAAAILAMTNAAGFRTDYANRLGTAKPSLFESPWTDSVSGRTFGPGEMLGLARQFAHPKAWADPTEVSQLKKEQTQLRRTFEQRKEKLKIANDQLRAPFINDAKAAKLQRDIAFKAGGRDSTGYIDADADFQRKQSLRDTKLKEIDKAEEDALAQITKDMDEASRPYDIKIAAASERTDGELLRRYLDDVVDLQEALARLALALERRSMRRGTSGPAPEVKDPRDIDFLDPERLADHKPPAPLHFSAQETQP